MRRSVVCIAGMGIVACVLKSFLRAQAISAARAAPPCFCCPLFRHVSQHVYYIVPFVTLLLSATAAILFGSHNARCSPWCLLAAPASQHHGGWSAAPRPLLRPGSGTCDLLLEPAKAG